MTKTFNIDEIRAIINSMPMESKALSIYDSVKNSFPQEYVNKADLIKRFEEAKR